ncbi:MAG: LLM class F420-dependent oxidoreductase [Acidimicrobiales bacterium]|nr:LLM class F420-dependent oxidoreductase [Acidimicrobiales bacterium]
MTSHPIRVGVQLQPQATPMAEFRAAWRNADELGADSIWTWDHFYPLYGDPDASHFEGWTVLSAMAADTSNARLGTLVTGNSYRNPELLADMARTLDHISGGRMYLGVGAGWFERDYDEYGYEFGTAGGRLRQLGTDLQRMKDRISKLNPQPLGDLPILIGGSGEKVTLKLVAQHADAWNTFGPPEHFAQKNAVLDNWCAELGRDPGEIERTVAVQGDDVADIGRYLDVGATHIIVMCGAPFDLAPLEALIGQRDALG